MRRSFFVLLAAVYFAGCGEAEAPTPADAEAVEVDTSSGPSLVRPGQAADSIAAPMVGDSGAAGTN